MTSNCPICNKAGLPDFTKTSVVCPQCNSDLKAFLLLNSISTTQRSKLYIILIISFLLLSFFLLGSFMKLNSENKEMINTIMVLNDSISNLNSVRVLEEAPIKKSQVIETKEAIVKYVVKKGDYPYKIAQFFYGDGKKYKKIEIDNNLEQPYTLRVGQILLIKISKE